MTRLALLPLLLLLHTGCARWGYSPTWSAVENIDDIAVSFETVGARCGTLKVRNRTAERITVYWSDVLTVLPDGQRNRTWLRETDDVMPPETQGLQPGDVSNVNLCMTHNSYRVRMRPPTGWDFALGWMFGAGILAGNIKWRPTKERQRRVVGRPRDYGYELWVPVRNRSGRHPVRLPVRGKGVTAFKYSKKFGRPSKPQPLE